MFINFESGCHAITERIWNHDEFTNDLSHTDTFADDFRHTDTFADDFWHTDTFTNWDGINNADDYGEPDRLAKSIAVLFANSQPLTDAVTKCKPNSFFFSVAECLPDAIALSNSDNVASSNVNTVMFRDPEPHVDSISHTNAVAYDLVAAFRLGNRAPLECRP